MLKWSANLSFLFKELPFVERVQAAADAGFWAVEFGWPADVSLDALVAAQQAADVHVPLFNIDAGNLAQGERGFVNLPTRKSWWRERTELALELAQRLNAPCINALAGNDTSEFTRNEQMDCLLENLNWALPRAEAVGVTVLLEPLNRFESPRYLIQNTDDALNVMTLLNSPANLKIQFDIYHTQRNEGNLTKLLQAHATKIRHIQIADSPDRHEPGTGEINWRYVLAQVEAIGYEGYIGLEYNPTGTALESLAWLPEAARRECRVGDLRL
ncbi:MAG TPA: TIM barrel protein [Anaerolineae bacterium]|nr:TIM barrel protein [Anaerolineae bacterium]